MIDHKIENEFTQHMVTIKLALGLKSSEVIIARYGCLGLGPVTCYLILVSSYRRLLRYYACVRRRPPSHLITLNHERIE